MSEEITDPGLRNLSILGIRSYKPQACGFTAAAVRMTLEDSVKDEEVIHSIEVTIRIETPDSLTFPEVEKAFFDKAVEVLRRGLEIVERNELQTIVHHSIKRNQYQPFDPGELDMS